jgi:hypothetical protein
MVDAVAQVEEAKIQKETQKNTEVCTVMLSRGQIWNDEQGFDLISVMNKETILLNLDKAKTPQAKQACYAAIYAQLQKKGKNIK